MRDTRNKITVRVFYDGIEIAKEHLKNLVISSSVVDRIVNSVTDRPTDVDDDIPRSAS